MFGKKKEVKEVTNRDGFICWEVPLNLNEYDVPHKAVGLELAYLKNGTIYTTAKNGETVIVNPKKDRKQDASYKLVALAPAQDFRVDVGVCKVKFFDKDLNYDTEVGSNATITFRVMQSWDFYRFNDNKTVSVKDLTDKFIDNLKPSYSAVLAKYLASKRKYDRILSSMSELSEDLKNAVLETLKIDGLSIANVSINDIVFSDEYLKARQEQHAKENFEEEQAKIRRAQAQQARVIMNMAEGLNKNNKND